MHDQASYHYGQLELHPAQEIWRRHTTFLSYPNQKQRNGNIYPPNFFHHLPRDAASGIINITELLAHSMFKSDVHTQIKLQLSSKQT